MKVRNVNVLLSAAIGSTLASVALGQEAQTLQKIRVEAEPEDGLKANDQESATKMPLSIRETPRAISVVTSESIEQRQARDITSALELVAGLVPA